MTKITEYARSQCPICGRRGWCGGREDGLVLCKRPPMPRGVPGFVFKGIAKDGVTGMYVENGRERKQPGGSHRRPKPPQKENLPPVTPEWLNANNPQFIAEFTPERQRALADELHLPTSAFSVLQIGWWPDRRWWNPVTQNEEGAAGCWTFPECDARGRIIGIGLRWPGGRKGQMSGSRRGLILPAGWRELPDPVFVVEGPSDVLAGRALGMNVIGRPSNNGGVEFLAQACRNRQTIVFGENDKKTDGRWPGREGAEGVARNLETAWDRPVPNAFPPEGIKDLREWFGNLAPDFDQANYDDLLEKILAAITPRELVWLVHPPDRRNRTVVKVFRWSDGAKAQPIHTDRIHLDQESDRRRFARAVVKAVPLAEVGDVLSQILALKAPLNGSVERGSTKVCEPYDRQENNPTPAPVDSTLPKVFLPGGPVSIQASATQLGELLATTNKYFVRGTGIVTVATDDAGQPMIETLSAAALASVFETIAQLMEVSKQFGQPLPQPTTCSEQKAKLIQHCAAFQAALPPLRLLSSCPVLIERDGTLIQICGYDRESGIMAFGDPAQELPLPEAVAALQEMLTDFRFATPSDKARALAAVITPALLMGGLLGGRAPMDVGEADSSQSGKGFRNKLTAAIYNQTVRAVTQKKGGVGSLEETFSTALIRGRLFISLDNVRGQIDSPAIESFLTEDSFLARTPHQAAVEIDPRRVVLQLTSNKAEITIDLANRSSCVRILKQAGGYRYREFAEGDILDHIRANQSWYLGAVFSVVRAWYLAGKPRTSITNHDFRAWARTLDWMVQNLCGTGPLLDGHRETQVRMATPALNWLRDVALAVRDAGQMGIRLRTNQLFEILTDSSTVEIPGIAEDADAKSDENRTKVLQAVGRRLGQCFRNEPTISIDGFVVDRCESEDLEYRRTIREYCFRLAEGHPIDCAYAPAPPGEPIGAEQEKNASKLEIGDVDAATDDTDSSNCAYGAPIAAPMKAPIIFAVAPIAPNGPVKAETQQELSVEYENRGINNSVYSREIESIGALGAPAEDLPCDLFSSPPPCDRVRVPQWVAECGSTEIPPWIEDLVRPKDGWTPESWRDRLLQLAELCTAKNPERANELRTAAALMVQDPKEMAVAPASHSTARHLDVLARLHPIGGRLNGVKL